MFKTVAKNVWSVTKSHGWTGNEVQITTWNIFSKIGPQWGNSPVTTGNLRLHVSLLLASRVFGGVRRRGAYVTSLKLQSLETSFLNLAPATSPPLIWMMFFNNEPPRLAWNEYIYICIYIYNVCMCISYTGSGKWSDYKELNCEIFTNYIRY